MQCLSLQKNIKKLFFVHSYLILGLGVVMDRRLGRRGAPLCNMWCGCLGWTLDGLMPQSSSLQLKIVFFPYSINVFASAFERLQRQISQNSLTGPPLLKWGFWHTVYVYKVFLFSFLFFSSKIKLIITSPLSQLPPPKIKKKRKERNFMCYAVVLIVLYVHIP